MCKRLIYVMMFVLALGSTAHAALYLWNGSAGDGNWDTPANWIVTDSLWTWPNEETGGSHINSDTIGIDILNGDAVSRDGALRIKGADASTTPVLTLNNGSSLTLTDRLATIGDPNIPGLRGQIDILGGSTVTLTGSGTDLKIADDDNTWGTLNIVDSTVDIADDLEIDQGEGHVNISGNSTVNVNGDDLTLANSSISLGYLNISGNAVVTCADDLKTDDGEGHITITDNAIVNVDDFVIVDNDGGVGSLEISGNATINSDDFKIVDDQGGTGSMVISGNATINCDDYYGNDDSGDPSTSTVTIDGGTVNVGDDTTFNDDNPGTATITINSGSWLGNDRINVSDNLNSTVHLTINGGQMICKALRLGEGGGDDVGQIRINLNGGILQADSLSIAITDTQIIYTGGLLRIGSTSLNEADMQQMITDGTIIVDGVYSIATDGDYTVLNPLSPTQAKLPNPANGADGVLLGTTLRWAAGETAATHDVYFGTSSPPAFIGNQEAGTYYPGPIEVGTTYYWQIDEVEADGTTKHAGDIWSFTATTDLSTVSEIATQANPADGAGGVALDATLSWWPGASAVSHDVYLGTTSPPALLGSTTELSFDPGPLESDGTYYWRVDAVAADGTIHTGDIWSFKTLLDIPITDPNLLCLWTFDEGQGTAAIDWSGHGNYGTVNGATWVADGQVDGALDFGGDGGHVLDDDAENYLNGLDALTISMWIKSDVTNTDKGFIICSDPAGSDDIVTMRYDKSGASYSGTDVMKMGLTTTGGEQQLESSSGVQVTEWQHVAMTWSSGQPIRFYISGVEDTPSGRDDGTVGTITGNSKLIIGKGGKDEGAGAGWDGMIDDVRIYNIVLSDAEIYAMGASSEASAPSPADGATEVEKTPTLSWMPGVTAASHDVYFGDSSPPAFIGNQTETSYSPGTLDKGKTYYWRIDEVEADGTTKYEGGVWSFTVSSAGR
ncbi:MAG: LamG-like jellyroll fold domain-containing protein [Planctomycetota bacterium]